MDLETLLRLCKRYGDLGGAIQEQLHTVVNGAMDGENYNPNAGQYIKEWLHDAQVESDLELEIDCVLDNLFLYEHGEEAESGD